MGLVRARVTMLVKIVLVPQLGLVRVMLNIFVRIVPNIASYPIMHVMINMELTQEIKNVIIAWYVQ